MNYYITGLNENGLGETVLVGKTEKLIKTEELLEGRKKWTVQSMPNLDGIKTIAEAEAINQTAKDKAMGDAIQAIKKLGNDYVADRFLSVIKELVDTTIDSDNKPLAFSVKNDFMIPISQHVTEACTAIATGAEYDFNLEQFTTEITEQQIRDEAGG